MRAKYFLWASTILIVATLIGYFWRTPVSSINVGLVLGLIFALALQLVFLWSDRKTRLLCVGIFFSVVIAVVLVVTLTAPSLTEDQAVAWVRTHLTSDDLQPLSATYEGDGIWHVAVFGKSGLLYFTLDEKSGIIGLTPQSRDKLQNELNKP